MPPKSTTTRKRKSDTDAGASNSKKARTTTTHPAAIRVDSILANKSAYTIPEDEEETRKVLLSEYARTMKLKRAAAESSGVSAEEELRAAAGKIKKSAHSGICKQMTWKPSCKTGSAKFSYDGACADPEVFGMLMGLDGPPSWKMKKLTIKEFERCFGECVGKARYNDLYVTGKTVNVRYSADGEFKVSGSYGTYERRFPTMEWGIVRGHTTSGACA